MGDDSLPYTRSVFDRDYWLSHADGFAVDAARGRVGVVEEVRFGSRIDRPDFLVVRAGRFGRRRLLVPVEDVEQVRPRAKKLQLRPTADPLHHDSSQPPRASGGADGRLRARQLRRPLG